MEEVLEIVTLEVLVDDEVRISMYIVPTNDDNVNAPEKSPESTYQGE